MIYNIKNIMHSYNGATAFETSDLSIPKASITGLAGPNGAGKTTLLNILGLIYKPTSGIVLFKGKPVQPFSKFAKSKITLLNQEPYLLKRTVFNNVAYGLMLRKETKNIKDKVYHALDAVGLDGGSFSSRFWSELSGGEARRVALAARLVLNPDVLILDEPTANIDAESSILIRQAALNARDKHGTTLIISSHDHEWLYDVSDTVLNLYNGKILSGDRLSLIFGPWEPTKTTLFKKEGADFLIPEPPAAKAVAYLSADAVGICHTKEQVPQNASYIRARLKSVMIDSKTGKRYGTLKAKDLTLLSELDNNRQAHVTPETGQTVFVFYDPCTIKFTT